MLTKTFRFMNFIVVMFALAFMTLSVPAKSPPSKQVSVQQDVKNVPSVSALFESCEMIPAFSSDIGSFAAKYAKQTKFKTKFHQFDVKTANNKKLGEPPEVIKRE